MTCLALVLLLVTDPCVQASQDTTRPPREAIVVERSRVEVHAGMGYESLTAGMADWSDASMRVQLDAASGGGLHAEAVRTNRFDRVDSQLRLGAKGRLPKGWSGHGEFAVSATGHVLPDVSFGGTLSRQLRGGWVLGLGGRHDAYAIGDVDIGTFSADYYVGEYLLGYALSVAFVGSASAPGHRGSATRYYGDGNAFTLLAAAGESVERVSGQDLLVTDVVAFALWGVHWVGPRLGLTWGATLNRQIDLYDRRRGEVGVRLRM